jgi:hypothetical protein
MRSYGFGVAAILLLSAQSADAQTFPIQVTSKINKIWSESSRTILELQSVGPCGSIYFDIARSNGNFSEMTALMFTAAASSRSVQLELSGCSGQRNVVSHGAAIFN